MFGRRPHTEQIDELMTQLTQHMKTYGPDTPEFLAALSQLERLNDLKGEPPRRRINPDTLVLAGANIVGILIMVGYERMHVVTTKALGFLNQPKITQ